MSTEPKERPPHFTATIVGLLLMLAAGVVIVFPVFTKQGLTMTDLWAALGLGSLGGLLVERTTFRIIAADLIDNLPGGK